jgi:hypothetical protein
MSNPYWSCAVSTGFSGWSCSGDGSSDSCSSLGVLELSVSWSDETLAVTNGDSVGSLLSGGTSVVTLSVGAAAADVEPCSDAMYSLCSGCWGSEGYQYPVPSVCGSIRAARAVYASPVYW